MFYNNYKIVYFILIHYKFVVISVTRKWTMT